MSRYRLFLLLTFLGVWGWSAWQPKYQTNWLLENLLVFICVPLIFVLGRYFEFSDLSYTCITAFLCLHVIGAHYTYAEVPFGFTLQSWLNAQRNMYDRLVHFSFGLLLAYPMREALFRVVRVRRFWGYYLPLDLTFALSAFFEVMEWVVVLVVDPASGAAYLGMQGDEWDAQKDMLSAGVGAIVAMLVTAAINWYLLGDRFVNEMKRSFDLRWDDEPLGEEVLKRIQRGEKTEV